MAIPFTQVARNGFRDLWSHRHRGAALGPTLGGLITDSYSWRWIFLINLPVGVVALTLIFATRGRSSIPETSKAARCGWIRSAYRCWYWASSAPDHARQGQEDDWFSSHFIVVLAVIAVVCLAFLVLWNGTTRSRSSTCDCSSTFNFAGSCIIMFSPESSPFRQRVMPPVSRFIWDTRRKKAGLVFLRSWNQCSSPYRWWACSRLSFRQIPHCFRVAGVALAMFWSAHVMSMQIDIGTAAMVMVAQFVSRWFHLRSGITASLYWGAEGPQRLDSGLTNFMRNIGSGIGTSLVLTVIARRRNST